MVTFGVYLLAMEVFGQINIIIEGKPAPLVSKATPVFFVPLSKGKKEDYGIVFVCSSVHPFIWTKHCGCHDSATTELIHSKSKFIGL